MILREIPSIVGNNVHTIAALWLLISAFSGAVSYAQTTDFFSNTTSVDSLSTGSGGACPGCPGFNPSTLLLHAGTHPKPTDATIAFSLVINGVDHTADALTPSFNRLGPGAITDNLFGILSDPGADAAKCGINTSTGVLPTQIGLNCGDLRFDPASQGMAIPAAPTADTLPSLISQPSTFLGDFFPTADEHAGIDLKNRFIWNRTATTLTDGDLSVSCTAADATCIGGKQRQHEVIATPSLEIAVPPASKAAATPHIDTLASPGRMEQVFDQTTDWSITGSSGNTFSPPTLRWTLEFNDPILDNDNGSRMQTGALSGSFIYQGADTSETTFPTVTAPFYRNSTELCRGAAGTEGTCVTIP